MTNDGNDEWWQWDIECWCKHEISQILCGTSNILKSWNPPIPSRQLSSLTMSNFNAYGNKLKKFQCWPHSLLTVWGRWKTFVMGVLEVPWHFKRVLTKILQLEMTNDDNDTSMMNIDAKVLHYLKDYVGTLDIPKSWSPPILSRHVSSLTTSNFDAYMHSLKKFQRWPHSLLTMWGWWMTFAMGVLEVP